MADISPMKGRLLVVGANHRSSTLAVRDRLFVEDADVPAFLERLRRAGVTQAVILSTCDRVEVQAVENEGDTLDRILGVLAHTAGMEVAELEGQTYVYRDEDALRHVFAVAASLDSQVIGEPQVAGQVKAGHRMARDAGMCGDLEPVFQAAYKVAKRVRTETAIGERPVSIAAAAVQLVRDLHGDPGRCTGLLIGVGEMGELVAQHLHGAGLTRLTVIHPQQSRAQSLAKNLDCHWAEYQSLAGNLAAADVVLAALGGRRHVLSADMVRGALAKRRHKPMFLIDTAIPGDIEPAVNRLEEAFLYDLGDLEQVALDGLATREAEAETAWSLIDGAVADFLRGRAERSGIPALSHLRRHFEATREAVLAEAGDDAEKATRLLINRLLHGPSAALREMGREMGREIEAGAGAEETNNPDSQAMAQETAQEMENMVRRLFRLNRDNEE